ncbi:UNVERIFIED_CONTAM: Acidic leucine-rich nuclear phosphoprotein 32-related protein [Sesamum radiatum]|uniref:Acidic leucine-rich nuclear phosphoprotein 32-related protein n=1 Tax=Sesamum radiatum TaxID=300843 RepID=A0AAW2V4U7_SESRA
MDEIWERAVETALDGQTDVDLVRTLTLDGAVKCVHGRLPPPSLFEKFGCILLFLCTLVVCAGFFMVQGLQASVHALMLLSWIALFVVVNMPLEDC